MDNEMKHFLWGAVTAIIVALGFHVIAWIISCEPWGTWDSRIEIHEVYKSDDINSRTNAEMKCKKLLSENGYAMQSMELTGKGGHRFVNMVGVIKSK